MEKELWTPLMAASASPGQKPDSKLKGQHSWPFEFELPRTITIHDPNNENQFRLPPKFRLPPTFTESSSPVFIDYRLVVTIKRGGFRVTQV